MKNLVFLLLVATIFAHDYHQNYTLKLLSTDRGARCLDGSPAGFYYHEGSGSNKSKFLIHMNEGSFCVGKNRDQTLLSCYQRSKSPFGSTNKASDSASFKGILSTNKAENPTFHDWTKISLIYCDGGAFTGSLSEPVEYKGSKLYFRGYNNTLELFRYLSEQYDFFKGDTIVLAGKSAGGAAAMLYSNYLMEHAKTAKIRCISDSSLVEVKGRIPKLLTSLLEMIHEEGYSFPMPECFKDQKGNKIACYSATVLSKYVKAPIMTVKSLYDNYANFMVFGINCVTRNGLFLSLENCDKPSRGKMEVVRKETIAEFESMRGNRTDIGVWAPACSGHIFTSDKFANSDFSVPEDGLTVAEAIDQFMLNPEKAPWLVDEDAWPCNRRCSGLPLVTLRIMG